MFQYVVVFLIVALCAWIVGRHLLRTMRGSSTACSMCEGACKAAEANATEASPETDSDSDSGEAPIGARRTCSPKPRANHPSTN